MRQAQSLQLFSLTFFSDFWAFEEDDTINCHQNYCEAATGNTNRWGGLKARRLSETSKTILVTPNFFGTIRLRLVPSKLE